jgi:hypothetical protein
MKVKPEMSDYQKKTMIKFMQVQKVKLRSRKKNSKTWIKEIDETKEPCLNAPHEIAKRNQDRNHCSKNKYIIVQPTEREFDFMRYYGIV